MRVWRREILILHNGSESSTSFSLSGAKVPGNESSRERKYAGTKVPVTRGTTVAEALVKRQRLILVRISYLVLLIAVHIMACIVYVAVFKFFDFKNQILCICI